MAEKNIIRCAIISDLGCEKFAGHELKERFGVKPLEISNGFCTFDAEENKMGEIVYMSQTARRILIVLSKGKFDKTTSDLVEQVEKGMKKDQLQHILSKHTFRIVCERHGEHDFNSVIAEQEVGRMLETKSHAKVELKNPDFYMFLSIIDDSFIIGLDLAGKDLGKREYRVFNHPNSIKGTIAFSAIMFSGYKPGMNLLDPFALSGEIPIETALFESGKSVNFYDKNLAALKAFPNLEKIFEKLDKKIKKSTNNIYSFDGSFSNVSAQKKNSTIAGIEKHISFSRTEGGQADLKFIKTSVDIIVTRIIEASKHVSENKAKRIQEEFFKHITAALNKNSKIVFISRNPEHILPQANKANFLHKETVEVSQGHQKIFFVKFEKKQEG